MKRARTVKKTAQQREKALAVLERLERLHPDAHCALDHATPFQLLVATVLSAQTTDVAVNKATPKLFARFPDAKSLAAVDPIKVEPIVSTLGFFRQKAKSIVGLSRAKAKRDWFPSASKILPAMSFGCFLAAAPWRNFDRCFAISTASFLPIARRSMSPSPSE